LSKLYEEIGTQEREHLIEPAEFENRGGDACVKWAKESTARVHPLLSGLVTAYNRMHTLPAPEDFENIVSPLNKLEKATRKHRSKYAGLYRKPQVEPSLQATQEAAQKLWNLLDELLTENIMENMQDKSAVISARCKLQFNLDFLRQHKLHGFKDNRDRR